MCFTRTDSAKHPDTLVAPACVSQPLTHTSKPFNFEYISSTLLYRVYDTVPHYIFQLDLRMELIEMPALRIFNDNFEQLKLNIDWVRFFWLCKNSSF